MSANTWPIPDFYWAARTEPEVIDGMWCPATICARCSKRFPPYREPVPSDVADQFCWGHEDEDNRLHIEQVGSRLLAESKRRVHERDGDKWCMETRHSCSYHEGFEDALGELDAALRDEGVVG